MKNQIIKGLVFLFVWAFIYWISNGNFGVISFLFAYIIVYSVGKGALLFLANEFDKNHNSLAENVRDLYERIDNLENENENLRTEIKDLQNRIDDLEPRENFDLDA